jgi:hypothetical protein
MPMTISVLELSFDCVGEQLASALSLASSGPADSSKIASRQRLPRAIRRQASMRRKEVRFIITAICSAYSEQTT